MLATSTVAYQHFLASLPRRPYATNDFTHGLYHRPQDTALANRYIQADRPYQAAWLKFDLDYPEAGAAWIDRGLPPPTLLVGNPRNGRAHYLYGLHTPVVTSLGGRAAPLKLMGAVEAGMSRALRADPAYAAVICKTPFHPAWDTRVVHDGLYELKDLLTALPPDVSTRKVKRAELLGASRNLDLFDAVRLWAYQHAREARKRGDFEAWRVRVLEHAVELNAFHHPLPSSEVRSVARSVAAWTWRHAEKLSGSALGGVKRSRIRSEDREAITPEEAKERERAGALRTAAVKRARTFDAITAALAELAGRGVASPSHSEVARLAGLSVATVSRFRRDFGESSGGN